LNGSRATENGVGGFRRGRRACAFGIIVNATTTAQQKMAALLPVNLPGIERMLRKKAAPAPT
jgi:hypothetical protein